MEIIPVIDIREGVVVRAIAGRRQDYQPLDTPLAASADPKAVARGLMSLYPFRALYVADLDAIERRGDNRAAIAAIAETIAPARLWLDVGLRRAAEADRRAPNLDNVIGSETLEDAGALQAVDPARCILSLDFAEGCFLGDARLLANAPVWPDRVIVMSLARVGGRQGPDVPRLREIAARAKGRRVYAAGGVRGVADLRAIAAAGAAGALVATALHDGRLTGEALSRLDAK